MMNKKPKRIEIIRVNGPKNKQYEVIFYYGLGIVEYPFKGTGAECQAFVNKVKS